MGGRSHGFTPGKPTRNLTAEKMKMIQEKQQKFANLGSSHDSTADKDEAVSAKETASTFGEIIKPKSATSQSTKPKTAVQMRREEFERKQQEAAKQNDPKAFMQISWQKSGSAPGQFKKTAKDSRGVAPKKSILDLP